METLIMCFICSAIKVCKIAVIFSLLNSNTENPALSAVEQPGVTMWSPANSSFPSHDP